MHLPSTLAAVLAAGIAYAHPGHADEHNKELLERREFLARHVNHIQHCEAHHKASGLTQRGIERRAAIAAELGHKLQGKSQATLGL